MTDKQPNDVAWNGADTLISVGESGVVLRSPHGTANGWFDVSSVDAPQPLTGVTWENANFQLLIVGAGSVWSLQDTGADSANAAFSAVATNGNRIVVVGTNRTIIGSVDGVSCEEVPRFLNQDLNDISWAGGEFLIVCSDDTVLSIPPRM